MTTSLATFATTHGVIYRVHYNTTVARTSAQVSIATCFTAHFQVMLSIGHHTYRSTASLQYHTHFTRGHFNDGILIVARHQFSITTCTANHLGTLTRTQFDIVNESTERNFGQQQRIANFGGNAFAGLNFLTHFQTLRSHNITLLTISIYHQSDTAGTVGVILYRFHGSGDVILIALEVDNTIQTFVTTTYVAHSHFTGIITTATLMETDYQRFLWFVGRNIVVCYDNLATLAGCCGFNLF